MTTRSRFTAAAAVLIAAGAAAAVLLPPGIDYEAIPPHPRDIERALGKMSISLNEAIELAERTGGGRAGSAIADHTAQPPVINVIVYADGHAQRFSVHGQTGAVLSMADLPRFPGEPVEDDWTETASGLKYYDLVEGHGPAPAGPTSRVTVHYTGWLVDGTKFDSSRDHGQPATFGLGQMIPGWIEGVGSMRVGGKRKLIIPHRLAFGEMGRPGIPPRATLVFDVELISVEDAPRQ